MLTVRYLCVNIKSQKEKSLSNRTSDPEITGRGRETRKVKSTKEVQSKGDRTKYPIIQKPKVQFTREVKSIENR